MSVRHGVGEIGGAFGKKQGQINAVVVNPTKRINETNLKGKIPKKKT